MEYILNGNIKITHPKSTDVFTIEQAENGRFYFTSKKGYNGYDGRGFKTLPRAITAIMDHVANNPDS